MPYLERPWGRMHYREAGAGPLVVLGHAFPLDSGMWEETMEALSYDFKVVAYDQRGFGHSAPSGGYALAEVGDDVVALVSHLGVSRFAMVGLSMGGYVALAIAKRMPDVFWALALTDTKAAADTPEARAKRLATAESVREPAGRAAWLDGLPASLLGETTRRERPDVVTRVARMAEAAEPNAVHDALLAMAEREDTTAALAGVKAPALVLVGEEDGVTPLAEASKLRAGLLHAEGPVVLPGAGHLTALETPRAYSDALAGFLRPHAARA